MTKLFLAAILGLIGIGIIRYRRFLLAWLLKMPRPRYGVGVERDIPVSMPDGVRLFTDHYYPKAAGGFPTLFIRTPYGRGKEVALFGGYFLSELPAQRFAERGYHVIVQGARGCLDSEGEFSPHINEAADGQATIDWIGRQPWFNGVLGTWGPSYLGYMQWAAAAKGAPALKAMVAMVTSSENYSVTHPDGAFGLETRLRWTSSLVKLNKMHGRPFLETVKQRFSGEGERALQAAYDHLPLIEADTVAAGEAIPAYREMLRAGRADDPYWTARDHSRAVGQVSAAVHLFGGWYDYYLRGLLRDYATLKAAGRRPYLTIGPWYHGDPRGMLTGLRKGLGWFDAQLKGDDGQLRQKPVRLFIMGAGEWRDYDDYPPAYQEMRFYLNTGAGLTLEPPAGDAPPDHYRYDPADPTPAVGGALLALRGAGPQDNRPLESRPDVLCYTTPPVEHALEIIGPVRLELYVRSSLAHTDFSGRLCDVAPDGYSTNICDGLFRLKPGVGEKLADGCLRLAIDIWATAHQFRPGHRMRLIVSSGAHPRWNRNPGTGEPLATAVKMVTADQTVYHDGGRPSALVLPVVKGDG